jgi:hypothetical protein
VTSYLVPCGLSVLDGLTKAQRMPGTRANRQRITQWAGDLTLSGHDIADVERRWRQMMPAVAADIAFGQATAEVAAETTTLGLRAAPGRPPSSVLGAGDRIVLLASDTATGLLSAMLVATILTSADTDRIAGSQTPETLTGSTPYSLPAGDVSVVRLTRLTERGGFAHAAFGTGQVMRALLHEAADQPVEVHLSGGLKATLLQTMALTEVFRSCWTPPSAVTAWYSFEPSDTGGAEAVQIGLRRFPASSLEEMRGELTDVRNRRKPADSALEGVAWELRHNSPELTAFGHGYAALLGPGHPGAEGDLG